MLLLFGSGLAWAAVLMFLLEPMAAKMVLPLLGGAPSVWSTCVVFFQTMLLAGYAYVHAGPRWLGLRRHAAFHVFLIAVSLLALPAALRIDAPTGGSNPAGWLLLALTKSIGLPFFLIACTAPLLQKWFSHTDHRSAGDPYFLYAASNLGSLVGLLLYPIVVEPLLPLRLQAEYWKYAYVGFAVVLIVCAAQLRGHGIADAVAAVAHARFVRPTLGRRLRWMALSFAPSSLMLAVTTFISTDIAAVPLLWVLPLALYLLTFVAAFSSSPSYPRRTVDRAFPLLVLPLVMFLILGISGPISAVVPIHLLGFFFAALVCHRALADDRPTPEHLTEFYFVIALGGVMGSLFNTFIAPLVFTGIVEYPAVLLLVCLLRRPEDGEGADRRWQLTGPVAAGVLTAVLLVATARVESVPLRFALLGIPAFFCLSLSRTRLPFAAAIGAMLMASGFQPDQLGTVLHADRTFFGAYKVRLDPGGEYRTLAHGTTLHGVQSLSPERRSEPLSYYHRTGPLGDVFAAAPAAASHPRIGVVGLGVGSVAAYRVPGQRWIFFEIDPVVEELARREDYFTYMSECGSDCRVVIGDARQSLAADSTEYGVLVLDAFSSDAIPMHLITRQALELYLARLAPGGVLAFHVSNRYLNLEPVLARLAEEKQLVSMIRRDHLPSDDRTGKRSSDWIVMARSGEALGGLLTDSKWKSAMPGSGSVWTDDYTNILALLARR